MAQFDSAQKLSALFPLHMFCPVANLKFKCLLGMFSLNSRVRKTDIMKVYGFFILFFRRFGKFYTFFFKTKMMFFFSRTFLPMFKKECKGNMCLHSCLPAYLRGLFLLSSFVYSLSKRPVGEILINIFFCFTKNYSIKSNFLVSVSRTDLKNFPIPAIMSTFFTYEVMTFE